ncbi:hypothetical protein ALC62_13350 [Cyphomyrmex costatus]|uniref:Double jelly roll-like domain-containing protein n=1 Tax=Cyphomyrmex costatus TaxID=456900 RepID=A0A151IA47_9HYME|nr:hypothetical protein ALC62_13350 [Cyphomyrmex costatus]
MNRDILKIGGAPIFDDRIVKIETHTYNPYANTTFGYSDEIRIPIQHQDLYTLPCESLLYIERKFVIKKKEGSTNRIPKLTNNCVAFMFDEIRYELDGVEIDRNRNVGITSTIKNYISLTAERTKTENGRYLSMGFRSWDLYEFPLLQSTTKHSWAVKTTSHLEKPRYVILSLQTGKRNVLSQDITLFDACRYGYLNEADVTTHTSIEDEKIKEAIALFQEYYQIPGNGILNDITIKYENLDVDFRICHTRNNTIRIQ